MMNPLVSIIVPVYNVEKYLEDCLNSLINQTLDNIEIICVNDGSTDNSLEILENYAKKDDRIKVYSKENTGLGATRNYAIDRAQGEYILFVDSDDWVDLDTAKVLYEKAKSQDLDLLFYLVKNYDESSDRFYEEDYYNMDCLSEDFENKVFTHKDIKKDVFALAVVAYNKFCRRNLLDTYNIRFSENIFFEDNAFHYEALLAAKRMSIIRRHFTLRRRRDDSITAALDDKFFDVIPVSNLIFDAFKKYDQFDFYLKQIVDYKLSYLIMWYDRIDEQYKDEFWRIMHDDFCRIAEDTELHNKFLNNLREDRKNFYVNTIESTNYEELDFYNLRANFEIRKRNELNRIKKENKKLNSRSNYLKSLEKDVLAKSARLIADNNRIHEKNRIVELKHDNLEKYFARKESYLNAREKQLMEKQAEFEKSILNKNYGIDEKQSKFEELLDQKESNLNVREKELAEKQAEFEKSLLKREQELKDKELELANMQAKFEKEFSRKNDLLNLREMELLEQADDLKSNRKIMPKISIVLSLFNSDNLEQCLGSVANQTLRNIEVLCIGNGLTDDSLNILNKYVKKDSRFKIISKSNVSGMSYLNDVSGGFVLFLDSNEWLELDACETMYMDAKLNNLDILLSKKEDGPGIDFKGFEDMRDSEIFSPDDLEGNIFEIPVSSYQALYDSNLLKKMDFNELAFNDYLFFWDAVLSSSRISLTEENLCFNRSFNKDLDYASSNVISFTNSLFNIFKKHNLQSLFEKYLANYKVQCIQHEFECMDDSSKREFWKEMKKDYLNIEQNNELHEMFMENLTESNRDSFIHVIQSRSSDELEYLERFGANY